MTDLSGVFAPLLTPFGLADGAVDHAWMRRHLAYLREFGCAGVVASGTNGEGPSLSVSERQAVLETALRHAEGMPVIAGTGAAALPDAIELTRHAFAAGAAAVLVLPPFYFKRPADSGIVGWFERLCDAAVPPGGRIVLYHIPQMTAVPFTDALLAALLRACGEIIYGIKDSTGDAAQGAHIRSTYPQLAYFCGNDHLLAAACLDGAAGSITATANAFPDLVAAVQRAAQNGGAGLAEAQSALDAARSLFEAFPIQPALKAALVDLAGLPPTAVRPPQIELTEAQQVELRRALAAALPRWRPTGRQPHRTL